MVKDAYACATIKENVEELQEHILCQCFLIWYQTFLTFFVDLDGKWKAVNDVILKWYHRSAGDLNISTANMVPKESKPLIV